MGEPSLGEGDLLIRREWCNFGNAPRVIETRYQPKAVRTARHNYRNLMPFGKRLKEAECRISRRLVGPFIDAIDEQKQTLVLIGFSYERYDGRLVLAAEPSFDCLNQRALIASCGDEFGPESEGNPHRQKVR